ncbi:PAAR domain-containing protein [Pseudomonas kielensis]|uniref:PAAR domain-containing protein n=1 Tax=Pseudomonas kielensis TaxID=2762577 RepID=A0A7X1GDF0_9PSED|nr:PAAR domain-containing protein [Pseudomonas kielensis]MBC2690421.1 PAAR domain-containing protein [Pseudomonas kielensis]
MRRYHITVGAKTTADGTVMTGYEFWTIDGQPIAREGDEVACPACDSTGVIVCDGPHLVDLMQARVHDVGHGQYHAVSGRVSVACFLSGAGAVGA